MVKKETSINDLVRENEIYQNPINSIGQNLVSNLYNSSDSE